MSDYRLHLMYGNTPAVHHSQLKRSAVLCPSCKVVGGHMIRLRRSWWRRLFRPQMKRYQCLECDHMFSAKGDD